MAPEPVYTRPPLAVAHTILPLLAVKTALNTSLTVVTPVHISVVTSGVYVGSILGPHRFPVRTSIYVSPTIPILGVGAPYPDRTEIAIILKS
jgi:hypothetical protein